MTAYSPATMVTTVFKEWFYLQFKYRANVDETHKPFRVPLIIIVTHTQVCGKAVVATLPRPRWYCCFVRLHFYKWVISASERARTFFRGVSFLILYKYFLFIRKRFCEKYTKNHTFSGLGMHNQGGRVQLCIHDELWAGQSISATVRLAAEQHGSWRRRETCIIPYSTVNFDCAAFDHLSVNGRRLSSFIFRDRTRIYHVYYASKHSLQFSLIAALW